MPRLCFVCKRSARFSLLRPAAPAPTQSGAGVVSPHAAPKTNGKGSTCVSTLAVCLRRGGGPLAARGVGVARGNWAPPCGALPPSGCRPRPLSFVVLRFGSGRNKSAPCVGRRRATAARRLPRCAAGSPSPRLADETVRLRRIDCATAAPSLLIPYELVCFPVQRFYPLRDECKKNAPYL